MIYPKPYSIYLRRAINIQGHGIQSCPQKSIPCAAQSTPGEMPPKASKKGLELKVQGESGAYK